MKKYILYCFLIFLNINTIFSQSNTIEVRDQISKAPIHGVTVHIRSLEGKNKDSMVVRVTDKSGKIGNPFNGKALLMFSFIGYNTTSDTLVNNNCIFYLTPSSIVMDEIVVTGLFKPSSAQESVYDIKVINQAKIESQGASSLRELLITESNMKIAQDGILGSSLSINGISGENIKIMIDGVPAIGRLNGNIDLSQINLNNIQRVEVIEGPMSTIYGSDALGGVINLITKDPNCERLEFEAGSYNESVGMYNIDGTVRYSMEDISFMVNGGRNLFQGFDPQNISRNVKWNPKEQYFLNFQSAYLLAKHNLKYQLSYFDEYVLNRGELRPPYFETAFDDKYKTIRWTNSIIYNGEVAYKKFVSATAAYSYYNRKKNTFFKDMLTLNEKLTESPSDQDTSDFYLYMIRAVFSDDNFLDFLKYQTGIDFNIDIATGQKIKNNKQQMSDYAGFLSVQYDPTDDFRIQPSLRVIYNSNYDAPLIPAINVKYNILQNLIFRGSYARGFRSPSIKELYYEFVDINHNIFGNEDLKAEQSDSYNASLVYSFNDSYYYFGIEPKFFYNNISHMITLASLDELLYKNVNIGKYETIGSNLTFKYFRKDISMTTTTSYIGRLNSLYEETGTRKYNFTTEFSINFDYNIELIDTKINLFYKYSGKLPAFTIVDEKPAEYIIEDYSMMDISLSKKLFEYFEISTGIKNIFDVVDINSTMSASTGTHGSTATYPIGWGRTYFLNFKFKVN